MDGSDKKFVMRNLVREYERALELLEAPNSNEFSRGYSMGYVSAIRGQIAGLSGYFGVEVDGSGGVPEWLPDIKKWMES